MDRITKADWEIINGALALLEAEAESDLADAERSIEYEESDQAIADILTGPRAVVQQIDHVRLKVQQRRSVRQ